jgi:hypothetical protein
VPEAIFSGLIRTTTIRRSADLCPDVTGQSAPAIARHRKSVGVAERRGRGGSWAGCDSDPAGPDAFIVQRLDEHVRRQCR